MQNQNEEDTELSSYSSPLHNFGLEEGEEEAGLAKVKTEAGPISSFGVAVNVGYLLLLIGPPVAIIATIHSAAMIILSISYILLFAALCICILWMVQVPPQLHKLVIFWGKFVKVYTEPGIYFFPRFGRTVRTISMAVQTFKVDKSKILDGRGNPILTSAVVTFIVVDSVRAAFDVMDYNKYMEVQALAVLKRVCALHSYEDLCRASTGNHALIGNETESRKNTFNDNLVRMLQEKADVAGIRVLSFELTDLGYAAEVVAAMLVRQQAEARVAARQTIVNGAVGIVQEALAKLEQSEIYLDAKDYTRVAHTLLAIICGSKHTTQPAHKVGKKKQNNNIFMDPQTLQEMDSALKTILLNTARNSQQVVAV
jgi:regulator of protease activity HflC (stomatin/prohibitin superfamily)